VSLKAGELTDLTFTVDPKSLGAKLTHGIFDWRDTAPIAVQRAAGNR
jgi:2-methylcitrate dehydratase